MNAVAYARFSSDSQREESIDAQLRAIRDYCQRNEINLIREYVDEARSATTDKRPGFQRMFGELDGVDLVIVHKLDRFSRDRYDSAIYRQKLKKAGVRLVSVLEHLDDSPESIILESVLEGLSEYYSKNLSRETLKGLKENAYKCKHTGGKPPLGYDVQDGRLVINPAEADIVKRIFEMYSAGAKYDEIISALGNAETKWGRPFTKTSLNSILNNEKYIGVYFFGRQRRQNHNSHKVSDDVIRIEGGVPRIIDDQTWKLCQERIRSRKRNASMTAKRTYLLSGKLVCECGTILQGMSSVNRKGSYRYYRCRNCGFSVNADKIEKDILSRLNLHLHFTLDDARRIRQMIIEHLPEKDNAKNAELKEIERRKKEMIRAVMDGLYDPAMKAEMDRLHDREKELQTKSHPEVPSVEIILAFLESVSDIQKAPSDRQKQIINRLVEKIEKDETQYKIEFRLPRVAGERNASWTKFTMIM